LNIKNSNSLDENSDILGSEKRDISKAPIPSDPDMSEDSREFGSAALNNKCTRKSKVVVWDTSFEASSDDSTSIPLSSLIGIDNNDDEKESDEIENESDEYKKEPRRGGKDAYNNDDVNESESEKPKKFKMNDFNKDSEQFKSENKAELVNETANSQEANDSDCGSDVPKLKKIPIKKPKMKSVTNILDLIVRSMKDYIYKTSL